MKNEWPEPVNVIETITYRVETSKGSVLRAVFSHREDISESTEALVTGVLDKISESLYKDLADRDPNIGANLGPSVPKRVARLLLEIDNLRWSEDYACD